MGAKTRRIMGAKERIAYDVHALRQANRPDWMEWRTWCRCVIWSVYTPGGAEQRSHVRASCPRDWTKAERRLAGYYDVR